MTAATYIHDVTTENFSDVVLENSQRVPVLVDFWAPWCGPCQTLMPLLTHLAEVYGGQFILAKINIDEQQDLAMRFGVRSVPTVKIFRNGEMVDEFLGALPESAIRDFLDKYVERESDRVLAQAKAFLAEGDLDQAVETASRALSMEPENKRSHIGLAEILLAVGRNAEARQVIDAMPANIRTEPEVARLAARAEFADVAANAPEEDELENRIAQDPSDSEARYLLSARRVMQGQYEGAMEQLLELVRRDRAFGNDAGREALLKIFDMLGGEGDLVSRYRRLMFNALH